MNRAIILDDEQSAINMLESYLEYFDFIELIDACKTMEDAEKAIIQHQPDLVFLDIRIKGEYVFTMLERLKNKAFSFAIIFVTGFYQEHLADAIQSCGFKYPFSYIAKPIDLSILQEELKNYQLYAVDIVHDAPLKNYLILKKRKGFMRVKYSDILYCESDGNYSNIFLIKDGVLTRKNTQSSLSQLEGQLNAPSFFRMSSKHLINIDYFEEVKLDGKIRHCMLSHKQLPELLSLPIPENKWAGFKDRLF